LGAVPLRVPLAGSVTTLKVNGSPSGSLPVSVIATGVFSAVVTAWSSATGGSFAGVTVMDMLTSTLSAVPSLTLKVKLSEPLKFALAVFLEHHLVLMSAPRVLTD